MRPPKHNHLVLLVPVPPPPHVRARPPRARASPLHGRASSPRVLRAGAAEGGSGSEGGPGSGCGGSRREPGAGNRLSYDRCACVSVVRVVGGRVFLSGQRKVRVFRGGGGVGGWETEGGCRSGERTKCCINSWCRAVLDVVRWYVARG